MVRTLLKMRGRGDYSETYGYAEGLGVKTVGFRSNAPAGPTGHFERDIVRAMAFNACGLIVFASESTQEHSYVWNELIAAEILSALDPEKFKIFLLELTPKARECVPDRYKSYIMVDANTGLDFEITRMLEHVKQVEQSLGSAGTEAQFIKHVLQNRIQNIETIKLLGDSTVNLDTVFTPLRGDVLSSAERGAAYSDYIASEKARSKSFATTQPTNRVTGRTTDREIRIQSVTNRYSETQNIMRGMPLGLEAVNTPLAVVGEKKSIAGVITRHNRLVILGEPAAGKSTLLQWLTLRYAESWCATSDKELSESYQVKVLKRHVEPEIYHSTEHEKETDLEFVSLGKQRLPIAASLSELVNFIQENGSPTLLVFLAQQLARGSDTVLFPDALKISHSIIVKALEKGQILVLLDGLDEVAENSKNTIINLIESFADTWVGTDDTAEVSKRNKIILTSRIIGYHTVALKPEWSHVVIDRMSPPVVREFWVRLFLHDRRMNSFAKIDIATEKSNELYDLVYDTRNVHLARIVGIPLLATLVARIYESGGSLPRYRSELYRQALAVLMKQRSNDVRSGFISRVLGAVAYELHKPEARAIVDEDTLKNIIVDNIDAIEEREYAKSVKEQMAIEFIAENKKYIGLLVERAPKVWAFVHRTFQEYLAGQFLAESVNSPREIAIKIIDPWWREAGQLMFGAQRFIGDKNKRFRDVYFSDLLNHFADASNRGRLGRALLEALEEMPDLPESVVMNQLVLAAQSDLVAVGWQRTAGYTQAALISSLYSLGRRDAAVLEAALCFALAEGPSEHALLVANVILTRHWRTEKLGEALKKSLAKDSLDQDFPITRAYTQYLTEKRHGELAYQEKRETLEKKIDEIKKSVLNELLELSDGIDNKNRFSDALRRYINRSRNNISHRYVLDDELVDTELSIKPIRINNHNVCPSVDIKNGQIDKPELKILHAANFGFKNFGLYQKIIERNRLVWLLKYGELARVTMVDMDPYLQIKFGHKDTIYDIAVYLDMYLEKLVNQVDIPVLRQEDENLLKITYDKSKYLSDRMLFSARSYFSFFRNFLSSTTPNTMTDEEIIIAVALDKAATCDLNHFLGTLSADKQSSLTVTLCRLISSARDSVLSVVNYYLADRHFDSIDNAVFLSRALYISAHVIPDLPVKIPDNIVNNNALLLAERMIFRLADFEGCEADMSAAAALDDALSTPVTASLSVLQFIPETNTAAWARNLVGLHPGSTWPISANNNIVTLAAIDAASSMNMNNDFELAGLYRAYLSVVLSFVKNEGSALELASLAPFVNLPRTTLSWPMSVDEAKAIVYAANDPYHTARFQIGLFENAYASPSLDSLIFQLWKITDPVLRLDIAERLNNLIDKGLSFLARAYAVDAAFKIVDPIQRVRALVRLIVQDDYPRKKLIKKLQSTLVEIDHPAWVLHFLHVIRSQLSPYGVKFVFRYNKYNLWLKAISNGREAVSLLGFDTHGDSKYILYTVQTCLDMLRALQNLRESSHLDQPAIKNYFRYENPSVKKADLNVKLANRILSLARLDEPGCSDSKAITAAKNMLINRGYSLYAARRWLSLPNHPISWLAAFALAKCTPIRSRLVLEPLLNALNSPDEWFVAQAQMILSRGSSYIKRSRPDVHLEDMGLDTLIWMACKAQDNPNNFNLRWGVFFLIFDMKFSDAKLISLLWQHAIQSPNDIDAIRLIFSCISHVSTEFAEELLRYFSCFDHETQISVITCLANIYENYNDDVFNEESKTTNNQDEAKKIKSNGIFPLSAPALAQFFSTKSEHEQAQVESEQVQGHFVFPKGTKSVCDAIVKFHKNNRGQVYTVADLYKAIKSAKIDINTLLMDAESCYKALSVFTRSRFFVMQGFTPGAHDQSACHDLRKMVGSDSVMLTGELLVYLLRKTVDDVELLGLILAMTIEYALHTPTLMEHAITSRLAENETIVDFLCNTIQISQHRAHGTMLMVLLCILNPLSSTAVDTVLSFIDTTVFGNWTLIAQSISAFAAVERGALATLEQRLKTSKPSIKLIVVKMISSAARDKRLSSADRGLAREILTQYMNCSDAECRIFIFSSQEDYSSRPCIMDLGTIAQAIATELFLIDEAAY